MRTTTSSTDPPAAIFASPPAGRVRCAPSGATMSASSKPISRPIPASISPAMAAAATRMAITGSPAGSTTSSTSRATASAPPKWKARWSRIRRSPKPRSSAIPHDIKGQAIYAYVTLNAGEEGSDALRKELIQEVRQRHWRPRRARQDPVRARAAQDPIGQDHAADLAQDRRGRDRRLRRHLDPRRSRGRRCAARRQEGRCLRPLSSRRLLAMRERRLRRRTCPAAARPRPARFLHR